MSVTVEFVEGLLRVSADKAHYPRLRQAGFGWDKAAQQWVTPFSDVARKVLHKHPAFIQLQKFELWTHNASTRKRAVGTFPVPDGLTLRDYQTVGVEFLMQHLGALLADDMGIGKTVQAIIAINALGAIKVLIICPASVKINWKRELEKWLTLSARIGVAAGSVWPEDVDIVICNYDIIGRFEDKVKGFEWDVVILDEAQYVKNPKAKRTRAILGGAKRSDTETQVTIEHQEPIRARYRWALTGTPIENRIIEIFPVLRYLSPYAFPNKRRFEQRYCALQLIHGRWDNKGASNIEELQMRLRSSVMLRRRKGDVLTELPPKAIQVIELQPDTATAKLLKREHELTADAKKSFKRLAYEDGFGDSPVATIRREIGLRKTKAVIAHLHDCIESQGKVICFVVHKAVAAAIKEAFGGRAVVLTGDTSQKDRQAAIDRFQSDPGVDLFIGNVRAAGVGITLTASSHVVFAEMSWNPAENVQAEDRAHRIGQTGSVLVQYLVWHGSIDAYIAQSNAQKMDTVDSALDNSFLD